jgi:hypothetical protein
VTYVEYVATLAGLTVPGVVKAYSAPPSQLSTAQLPAMWPRLPSGERAVVTLGNGVGLTTRTLDLVLAVEAAGQGTQPTNYSRALTLIDALDAALEAAAEDGTLDEWALRVDVEQIGDVLYWAIVATVTGSG